MTTYTDGTTYTEGLGRIVHDADSHVMELPEWLTAFADARTREVLRPLHLGAAGALADQAVREAASRQAQPPVVATLDAVLKPKGWSALGAFDGDERSRVLDVLGVASQLVFSTFAGSQYLGHDPALLDGGTRAHNRAMVAFCSSDPRLLPVGFVVWCEPERMIASLRHTLDEGCAAIHLPSDPDHRGLAPTHPDYDPLWAELEARNVPFVLHVGAGGQPTPRAFHNNARPVTDFIGGGENIRAKDYVGISHRPEQFLAALILDGIFERFPRLMGGCIEQGAVWVPGWMRKMELIPSNFRKTEPSIGALSLTPTEYVHRNLRFTPFPGEPVGWMIEQGGADLYLFSTDYPHPEGTKDPIGRFEATMAGVSEAQRDAFYTDNFAALYHGTVPVVGRGTD